MPTNALYRPRLKPIPREKYTKKDFHALTFEGAKKEVLVLDAIADGQIYRYREIASKTGINPQTVHSVLRRLHTADVVRWISPGHWQLVPLEEIPND